MVHESDLTRWFIEEHPRRGLREQRGLAGTRHSSDAIHSVRHVDRVTAQLIVPGRHIAIEHPGDLPFFLDLIGILPHSASEVSLPGTETCRRPIAGAKRGRLSQSLNEPLAQMFFEKDGRVHPVPRQSPLRFCDVGKRHADPARGAAIWPLLAKHVQGVCSLPVWIYLALVEVIPDPPTISRHRLHLSQQQSFHLDEHQSQLLIEDQVIRNSDVS